MSFGDQQMSDDPWALPVTFYSIIAKTSSIEQSFPSGQEQFFRRDQSTIELLGQRLNCWIGVRSVD